MWEFLYHSFRVKNLSFYVLISTNTTERKKVYSGLTKIKISTILIATNSQLFENTLPLNEIVTTGETRNSKGPHTIDAANASQKIYNRSDQRQKYVKTNNRLQGWYCVQDVYSRHHWHNKSRKSRIATEDSCFVLIGTHQHCVAEICNASPRANTHKLHNDPFTTISSVPWSALVSIFLIVMLVSRNFFHAVSALKSFVSLQ